MNKKDILKYRIKKAIIEFNVEVVPLLFCGDLIQIIIVESNEEYVSLQEDYTLRSNQDEYLNLKENIYQYNVYNLIMLYLENYDETIIEV